MTPTLAICLLAVLAAVGAAIFEAGGSAAPTSTYGGAATVTIQDFKFGPALVTPGIVVTFKNLDAASHTVTSDAPGGFDTDVVAGGAEGTFTAPAATGEYEFHCTIHPYIKGKLVVAAG